MFPPEITTTTFFPKSSPLRDRRGARGAAPDGSAIILASLIIVLVAFIISSSVTVNAPSTFFEQAAKVMSPSADGRRPSAMEAGEGTSVTLPALSAAMSFGAPAGSTPKIFTFGLRALIAMDIPEMSPPPPTGTKTESKSCRESTISSPQVP